MSWETETLVIEKMNLNDLSLKGLLIFRLKWKF